MPSSIRALHLTFCVSPSILSSESGTGFSTSCPSPTPLGLGLGPGFPWADEPSPGILRFPAGRILTCLLAYLCQHTHSLFVHRSSQYGFCLTRTLPYHVILTYIIRSFGRILSPVTSSAQNHLTSELLRTLSMVAASEPTSWLSMQLYILFHLVSFGDLSWRSGLFPF